MSTPEIQAFWQHWPSLRLKCEHALATRDWGTLPDDIAARVQEIHPGLAWELAPGAQAQHAFCLSAEEDHAGRRVAQRWLRAAPLADATWEFHPARQPRPTMHLRVYDEDIDPAAALVRAELDSRRERVHVQVFHDAFVRFGEDDRGRVAFLLVDGVLGEDGVTRWIGALDAMDRAPGEACPLPELAAHVKTLADASTGQSYVRFERTSREGLIIPGFVNLALKWIDHLDFDAHVTIVIPLLDGDAGAAQREAGGIEDELYALLGDCAAHVGHEMLHGNRVVHFFSVTGGVAALRINGFLAEHPARGIRVRWEPDPDWETMKRWM